MLTELDKERLRLIERRAYLKASLDTPITEGQVLEYYNRDDVKLIVKQMRHDINNLRTSLARTITAMDRMQAIIELTLPEAQALMERGDD